MVPSSSPSSRSGDAAALAYADCLTGLGHNAVVQDGLVVYKVDSGGGISVTAGDVAEAEKTCRAKVPAYRPPDDNQR